MAQRFGGKFSPDGQTGTEHQERSTFEGARVDPVGLRANLMFIPPLLLGFLSLNEGAIGLTVGLAGSLTLILGAWLLREGLRAEAEYDARKVARRPAMPRKIAAGILCGLGIALAAFSSEPNAGQGLIAPILYGLVSSGLHFAAFGLDPLKNKGMEGIDTFQQDRVARVVNEAEKHLLAMSDAIKRVQDRKIEARVERFQSTARDLFRTVEEDPRDLTSARKYLTVYLLGARDATIKYADIQSRQPTPAATRDFLELLDDLEQNFAARTRKMLLDDHSDLTVEIDVLRDRLQREGVKPE